MKKQAAKKQQEAKAAEAKAKNIDVEESGAVFDLDCSGTELSATTPIALSNGVSVTFEEVSGFSVGDKPVKILPRTFLD